MNQQTAATKEINILVIKGQGIGPECVRAAKMVLAATDIVITYTEGTLGCPDAGDLMPSLQQYAPDVYASEFGDRPPADVAFELESHAKAQAVSGGNINDFYRMLLAKLAPATRKAVKSLVSHLERQTLSDASKTAAVLKGALRTLDEGDEPSRKRHYSKGLRAICEHPTMYHAMTP